MVGHNNILNVCDEFIPLADAVGIDPDHTCDTCGFPRDVHRGFKTGPLRQLDAEVRAEQLRVALRTLHDEVVDYLNARDLEVVHLPVESPLRQAIERARDLI